MTPRTFESLSQRVLREVPTLARLFTSPSAARLAAPSNAAQAAMLARLLPQTPSPGQLQPAAQDVPAENEATHAESGAPHAETGAPHGTQPITPQDVAHETASSQAENRQKLPRAAKRRKATHEPLEAASLGTPELATSLPAQNAVPWNAPSGEPLDESAEPRHVQALIDRVRATMLEREEEMRREFDARLRTYDEQLSAERITREIHQY